MFASSVKAPVFEERGDLSNDMTGRQRIAVGVRRLVLARGELDRLEGPGYGKDGGAAPKGARSRENNVKEGGGGSEEGGRGERRDRGRSDKGEHDEKGATARWHEG